MIDFTLLPSSNATDDVVAPSSEMKLNYTSMAVPDEMGLYKDLNARLIELEKKLKIDTEMSQSITEDTSGILIRWNDVTAILK